MPPLDERVAVAVSALAESLRAEHFDLATWDRDARASARRLGMEALPAIAARLETGSGDKEERLSAAELMRLVRSSGHEDAELAPPAIEAELLGTILAHESEPRLATVAARAHAGLGGAAALRFWTDAASGAEDPRLAELALRAFGAVDGERAANEVASALEAATDERSRERLVIVLGELAPTGAGTLDATDRRCREVLLAVAQDGSVGPGLRRRARSVLSRWPDAVEAADSGILDDVLVLHAEPEQISRAGQEVFDLSRTPAQRRRDASLLAGQGESAADALGRVLLHDPEAEVRSAAAASLGRGALDADARRALEQASETDPSAAVRRQAEQALGNR